MANTLKFGGGTWATKEGSTLAYNDENNNFKPLPFTTTRTSSATRVNKEGLIEVVENDRPRIDYTDSADGALLLEPSRTNLFPYSEDFENSDWTKNAGTTITNNYAISPDGSLNASRYLGTGASGLGDKFTLSATSYTISFWVKSNTNENQLCRLIGDSSNVSSDLLITTEWTRLSYTFTGSGLSSKTNGIFRDSDDNDIDILIWGAQLEQGSYASSYIPTQGSAVTRSADTASGSGNSEVFNDSEGVLFADIAANADDLTQRALGLSDGTSSNRMSIVYNDGSSNALRMFVSNPSGTKSYITNSFNITQNNKISIKLNGTSLAFWVNGFEIHTDTLNSAFVNGTLDTFDFAFFDNNTPFYGKTKEIAYYDTALTDLELETLTSYRSLNELVTELNLKAL